MKENGQKDSCEASGLPSYDTWKEIKIALAGGLAGASGFLGRHYLGGDTDYQAYLLDLVAEYPAETAAIAGLTAFGTGYLIQQVDWDYE